MANEVSTPTSVQEGSRWRHAKPSSDEVANWFSNVPLDAGMSHEDYVSGVVLIPASEKIRRPRTDGRGTEEVYEQTFTPYVRVDTRVAYFWSLAETLDCVGVIEPVAVPRTDQAAYYNRHMPDGFWWHIGGEGQAAQRFLCCTRRVALYRKEDWFAEEVSRVRIEPEDVAEGNPIELIAPRPRPLREGIATKQVTGNPDPNGLAKAETGAVGRALGMAGILVVGTGIATAEDMAELREQPERSPVALPVAGAGEESEEALNERLVSLQAQLRPLPAWREFSAWWAERSKQSGWRTVSDAPVEARRGVATKMQSMLVELSEQAPADSSPTEGGEDGAES